MPDTVIQVENIGKKYMISHSRQYKGARYSALRDIVTDKVKAPFRKLSHIISHPISDPHNPPSVFDRPHKEEFWALKDVSFEVKQGEVVGIIGRNGTGKTTLLKILSRITEPTTGRFCIKGRVSSLLEVGTGFHPELTGRENIFLNGAILGMTKAEIRKKFDEIVAFAEIEKFLDTPVKRYSSGMYVRLAFSVAAHLDPEILIVDEVLAVGDIAFQKKCLGKMGEVAGRGRTVLFVSHQMQAIRALCQLAILIHDGRIIKKGSTHEIVRIYEDKENRKAIQTSSVMTRSREDTKNSSFYFKSVEMLNIDGKTATRFIYNETLVLIVDLIGESASSHYSVEFRIFGEVGTGSTEILKSFNILCVGASGPFHNLYFDKRVRKVRIDIGPLFLSSGNYSISLSVMTGTVRSDTWENACSFQIFECQPVAVGHDIHAAGYIVQHTFSEIN